MPKPDLDSNDAQAAAEFAAALQRHDYRAATALLTNVSNAGNPDLAALLLEQLVQAGTEAVAAMGRTRTVSVTQTIGNVPAGATVVGFRASRIS